jgi:nucleotide-binding universal stress UspA family protein
MKGFLTEVPPPPGIWTSSRIECGDPLKTILKVASDPSDPYDMIVMGTHGRTGMSHLLLGSLAEAVVRRAPCPVLTVRERHRAEQPIEDDSNYKEDAP